MREEYQDGHRYASSIYEEVRYPRMTLDALPLNRQRATIEATSTRRDRTMDERMLNNTEAMEELDQEMPAICDGDVEEALDDVRFGRETLEQFYAGIQSVLPAGEELRSTYDQFEWWVQTRHGMALQRKDSSHGND